jgi:hypothetical protein
VATVTADLLTATLSGSISAMVFNLVFFLNVAFITVFQK